MWLMINSDYYCIRKLTMKCRFLVPPVRAESWSPYHLLQFWLPFSEFSPSLLSQPQTSLSFAVTIISVNWATDIIARIELNVINVGREITLQQSQLVLISLEIGWCCFVELVCLRIIFRKTETSFYFSVFTSGLFTVFSVLAFFHVFTFSRFHVFTLHTFFTF